MVRTYPDTKDVGAFVLTGVKITKLETRKIEEK